MQERIPLLLIARPGRFRESLAALLAAAPGVGSVRQASDLSSALAQSAEGTPELVLLDAGALDSEMGAVLQALRDWKDSVRCIVLAEGSREQRQAEEAGADAVLCRGFPTAMLFALIDGMCPHHPSVEC